MALLARFQRLSHQADRYRWYALGLTTLGQAAANILSAGFGPLAPLLQTDFQISRAKIGLIVTALSALAIARSSGFWGFLASCLLFGLGNGIQNPAGSVAVMRWFPPRQRGVAMGIRQTGVPLGGILAASLAPVLAFA